MTCSIAIYSNLVWYIKGGTWWILMYRRFRIWMAKRGREALRPSWAVIILTLEQNHLERMFEKYKKILSGWFCSKVKIAKYKFLLHRPIFAGNWRSTLGRQNAVKKGPRLDKPARLTVVPDCHYLSNQIKKNSETVTLSTRGHFSPKKLVPLCITGFTPFMAHPNSSLLVKDGGRRVKCFSFSQICLSARTIFFVGLLQTQFWCQPLSTSS